MKTVLYFERIGISFLLSISILLPLSCATQKDMSKTMTKIDSVKGSVAGLESSVAKRQIVLSEEIEGLKSQFKRLESKDEEFRQAFIQLQRKINIQKIEMDESLKNLSTLNLEYQKSLEVYLKKISARIQDLDIALGDLDHRLDEISALESDQNRRLGETSNRLSVFLEEADLEHGRLKKGLIDLSQDYNKLADRINLLQQKMSALQEKIAASSPRYHVVASGESLSAIATKYGVSVEELVRLNKLKDPNTLSIGQKIFIPGP